MGGTRKRPPERWKSRRRGGRQSPFAANMQQSVTTLMRQIMGRSRVPRHVDAGES